jgi:exopolyphosphatase/guanosine-5'-triphosphate,3'-diphosphate pyrophosphatase
VRAAAVDIGTNTVRMLVADVAGDQIHDVAREVDVVGLGRGLDASGAMAAESMDAAIAALAGYGQRIRKAMPSRLRVVATSASRDASNSDELMTRIEAALGVEPDVITGEDEAALAFAGAIWGAGSDGRHLVIDPGGGSTEFVSGVDKPETAVSIGIGSVRLTDRHLVTLPPTSVELDRAASLVRERFGAVPIPESPFAGIGVAGTFTSLAGIHLRLDRYDRTRIHQTVLTLPDLERLVQILAGMTLEETEAIPSLDPKRAPVILAGAIVVLEAVRRSGLETVTISEADMLEGIVLGLTRE